MRNAELAQIFHALALYLEMKDEPFKPRAYEKVAYSLEALEEEAAEIHKRGGVKALREIPGVGQAIAEKIEELIQFIPPELRENQGEIEAEKKDIINTRPLKEFLKCLKRA